MKLIFLVFPFVGVCYAGIPIVVNTWDFPEAAQKAWEVITDKSTGRDNALDALTFGCNVCEGDQCGTSVGYGGNPDESGETTLDALIFDGDSMDMGAVGSVRRVKNAISVARHVLDYTEHSFLVGDLATEYAKTFNFQEELLQTNYSLGLWENWRANNCQPNFRKNVVPDPKAQCGPYSVADTILDSRSSRNGPGVGDYENHDTIGMVVISETGHAVAGTSTNGLRFKIPGRVGDSPIAGAGAYADSKFGAACATGNGDVMMRFLPSFLAVEQLRLGASPAAAAKLAISRIAEKYPAFSGALIVVDIEGTVGIACNGMATFPYVIASDEYPGTQLVVHNCTADNGGTFVKYSMKMLACAVLLCIYQLF